ncbi:MAG: hypothetical protein ACREYF_28230 [Gammaproteobacteria bacterium]
MYIHQFHHGASNLGKDEREQRAPIPWCFIEYEAQGAIAIEEQVIVKPEPQRNPNLLIEIFFPLHGRLSLIRVLRGKRMIRKSLV